MTMQTDQFDSALGHVELCNVPAPGKPHSEDLVQSAGSAAWLFDGTSAHDDPQACEQHHAAWFVEQLSRALADELTRAPSHPLGDALAAAISRVASSHAQLCPDARRGHGPSATAVIVRRSADALEYLVLGDSALLVQTRDGLVHHHSDKRLSAVEPRLRESIHLALRAGRGYDAPAHYETVRRLRATERLMRNREHGFWIAGHDPAAALHSLVGCYSLDEEPTTGATRIALISDGLGRGVTHLQCYRDWGDLLESLFCLGAPACIMRVRQAEQADPHGARHPRTRAADDAAAITCVLTP
jgi:hypothetical protein